MVNPCSMWLSLLMRLANGLSPCTLFLVALILKVGKCVLQLVENLAFIVVCIACQLCNYVLQIEFEAECNLCVILKVANLFCNLLRISCEPLFAFHILCKCDLQVWIERKCKILSWSCSLRKIGWTDLRCGTTAPRMFRFLVGGWRKPEHVHFGLEPSLRIGWSALRERNVRFSSNG